MPEHNNELTYHLLGMPLRPGSLYPGSENDVQAYPRCSPPPMRRSCRVPGF
jgi:hypothetical protein